jgi:hypothetical protein
MCDDRSVPVVEKRPTMTHHGFSIRLKPAAPSAFFALALT